MRISMGQHVAGPPRILTPGLLAGFGAIAIVLIGAWLVEVVNLQNVYTTNEAVAHTQAVKDALQHLLTTAVDAETGERGFLLTGTASYLEPYDRARIAFQADIAQVRRLTSDNRDQQVDLDRLSAAAQVKLEELAEAIRQRRESGLAAAQAVVATNLGKRTMDGMRVIVARMDAREDVLLDTRTAQAARSYRGAQLTGLTTTGSALLAVIVLFAGTRRFAEARLLAAQAGERFRVTLASIGDGVIATDDQGRITQMNAIAAALTGWSEADAAGRPVEEVFVIVNEKSRQPADNPIRRALREGTIVGLANHTVLLSKHGREIPIDDSAAPIKTADGEISGVVMVFRDITGRRSAEEERITLLTREHAARVEAETAAEQLRVALEAGRMGTWVYTMATGAVRWSPGLEAIHGFAPGTFPGTFEAFRNEIHSADRDHVLAAIAAAVDQRRDHQIEYRIVRSDGAVRWVEERGQLFCDQEGHPERMVGICLDVTERRNAEEKFRNAVEAAPAAMVMVDQRGTVVLINALTEQLLGYARGEILGQPMDRFVPPRFRDQHPEFRRGFFADPRQRPMGAGRDLYALRKDGSEVPVEIGLSPMNTAEGTFVLAAITDITERKRAAALLEEAVRTRDDFLAIASHELRNPVNAIQLQMASMLRAIERDAASLTAEWFGVRVGQANAQVSRFTRLIDNLLDVSRITSGAIVLEPEDVDLREVIHAVVDRSREELNGRQVTLRIPDRAVIGRWDRLRLEQVVTNLLSNAIKYGAGKPIEISLDVDRNEAQLSVTDHGIGIDEEQQKRLFGRFERAVSGLKYGGFGLGLWIARQVLTAMDGRISVQSQTARGSTFSVVLPLSPAGSAPEHVSV